MLGPGLLFAGAAIGVSHLVQSTRAGAEYGYGLIWVILIIHLFKYPFFEYGPRYACSTGESLLEGYHKMGKWVFYLFIIMTIGTMFTIQAAVTIVTASLAIGLFGFGMTIFQWVMLILGVCSAIMFLGRYRTLDLTMKIVIVLLTVSTLLAVSFTIGKGSDTLSVAPVFPTDAAGIVFLIALMGWMPAPIDLSVWHSLWAIEKEKDTDERFDVKQARFDFQVGFYGAVILAMAFLLLGAHVMFGSGETFSTASGQFSGQLINLYTTSLGDWAYWIIGLAAFTAMFSTTLTCLDALPRTMAASTALMRLGDRSESKDHALDSGFKIQEGDDESGFLQVPRSYYWIWMTVLIIGVLIILGLLIGTMGLMVQIATVLSFLTSPFFAIANFRLVTKYLPADVQPGPLLRVLSYAGIVFISGFCVVYLVNLLG
ncbi:MAG: Nramp family divalent metal transporter [Bacteroidota bacterium]